MRFLKSPIWMGIVGGALFASSTPPLDFYPGMLMSLMALAYAFRDSKRWSHGFGLGMAFATTAGLVGLHFVPPVITRFTDLHVAVAVLAWVLLALAQSLGWGVGMAIAVAIKQRTKSPQLGLASGMMVALWWPSVFSWSPATVLSPVPWTIQLADLVGIRGVSLVFGAFALAAVAAATGPRKRGRHLAIASALAVIIVGYGIVQTRRYGAAPADEGVSTSSSARRSYPMALVQAAVAPKARWERKNFPSILADLQRLSREGEEQGARLSLWPEAAYPYVLPRDAERQPGGRRRINRGLSHPIVIGYISAAKPAIGPDGSKVTDRFNSAGLVGSDGTLGATFDKVNLLAFGEAVPFGETFPALRRAFHRSGGLRPGPGPVALELPALTPVDGSSKSQPIRAGVVICYEDTLGEFGREIDRTLKPNLLVNLTNDAWFVGTQAGELHLRLAIPRSIELRLDTVRSVNLGVAAWIDAAGVVRARSNSDRPNVLVVTPTIRSHGGTPYSRFGDWPLIVGLCLGVVGLSLKQRTLKQRS